MQRKGLRGQGVAGGAFLLISVFIFALIGFALLPSLANSAAAAAGNNNVSAAPGTVPIINLSPLLMAVIVVMALLGAAGFAYVMLRGGG